ncbi:MAG: hypothetical protein U9N61_11100 [Euryarchaeota archaeon]|nr:hypothetical protein [Euryarchaeota archaeon]
MSDKTVISSGLSTNLYATNEQPVDMHNKMFTNYPSIHPLIALFTKISTGEAVQSRIDWTEEESIPDKIVLTAATGAGTATMTTTQYAYVRNWDLYLNPRTWEIILVDDDSFSGTITVQRGWGETTAAALVAGDVLYRIGNAYPENTEKAYPRAVKNTNFYNYTQEIVKSTRHSTRSMNETTFFGGKGTKRTENNRKMFYDFRKEAERGILFGTKADASQSSDSSAGNSKTFSGITEKLRNGTNYFDFNGVFTETKLDSWLTDIYSQFPDATNLIAVCPPKVYNLFNQIVKPSIRESSNSKTYGMNLKQYDGAVSLDLIRHPLLVGRYIEEILLVIDVSYGAIKYQKRPQLETDVAMKRYNYTEDKLSTLYSFLLANEARHGMAVGIKG